ncbi:MAG TPA: hypothetical protein VHI93_05615 [Candidatus Thermoplasmatota archaeon]|nr:hypothetical protein [Candidatus Thermoplasmatota archaeon]
MDSGARLSLLAFAAWWFALATVTAIGGMASLLAAWDALDPDLYIASTYYNLCALSIGLAGLLQYLLFLFTGKASWWKLLLPAYSAYLLFLIYVIRSHQPSGIELRRWNVSVHYEIPLAGDPLFTLAILLLVAPQMLGALAYFLLAFKARERTLKYRITLVSLSLLVWFGTALVASGTGLSESDGWQLASRAIGLSAAACILAAYYPPRPLRRRYGLVSIDEPLAR